MTIENRNEISDKKMVRIFELYKRLYNKEPKDYNELLEFHNLMTEITETFNIDYEQINEEFIQKYNKLINA